MKHYLCLFAVFFALLVFSCGEVGDGGYGKSGNGDFSTSCDGKPYDTSTSFCFEEKIYPFCSDDGAVEYDPNEQGCFNGKISPRCGEKFYDNAKSFCSGDLIYSRCDGGKQYTPDIEFCSGDKIYSKCDGKIFNPVKEFCGEDNEIYMLCDLKNKYNVITQVCFFNKVEDKCIPSKYDDEFCRVNGKDIISYRICGNKEYESAMKFCFNSEIYQKCGEDLKEYDPAKEFCHSDGSVYPRCSGNMYNPVNDFCFDNNIYSKCDNPRGTYNPKEKFCYNNVSYPLCNGLEYKFDQEFCSPEDYKVHPKCGGVTGYSPKASICYRDTLYTLCPNGSGEISSDNCITKYKICGNEMYNTATFFCYKDAAIVEKCGNIEYNPDIEFCYDKAKYSKCQVKVGVNDFGTPIYEYKNYKPDVQICNNGSIEDIVKLPVCIWSSPADSIANFCCFGHKYPKATSDNFCYRGELYPICTKKPTYVGADTIEYDPVSYGCFERTIYPKCSKDGITGVCVDNTVKRCKQLGSGMDHIIDPLPEMTCQPNGAITGISKSGGYKVAQIGNQVWLAENLREDYKILDEESGIESSSVCYGNISANCSKYGRLYDWALGMALENKYNYESFSFQYPLVGGRCPTGFYLPEDDDWQKLIDYAGGASIAGGRLKSTTGWNGNGNGTDSYGFNALAGGYYSDLVAGSSYFEEGSRSMWWSRAQNPETRAYYRTMIASDTEVRNFYQSKYLHKAYIRCLLYYKE